jgi:acetoacetyl-CoA synthetase
MSNTQPLWSPSDAQIAASNLTRFMALASTRSGKSIGDYDTLWHWSITDLDGFWQAVWDFAEVRASVAPEAVIRNPTMPGAEWFVGSRLNYAENMLRRRDGHTALLEVHESGAERRISYGELADLAAKFAAFLRDSGVEEGDRVAAIMPNRIETIAAMLGAASVGAIWSSCSPDFGFKGIMDRFGQIAPKVLLATDGYNYGGKTFSSIDRIEAVRREIPSLQQVVVVPVVGLSLTSISEGTTPWSAIADREHAELQFAQLPFDHPLYIMYSSGTTGVPKCIVHGHGGTLLQHAKEHLLHGDLKPDDVLFYFTTCGWMMWNWLVSGLMAGSTLVLFDGSPAHPDLGVLWRMASDHGLTHFGTSPKFLTGCKKAAYHPAEDLDLGALRVVFSTGAPLAAELFDWVYKHVKADVQLASICGGTDIISCFMGGSAIDPVYRGEIQKRGLAMGVQAWDGPDNPVIGQKGELVCTVPFPSMPVEFWLDPDGQKYHRAYFDHFPGVWRHGDFVEITERGGVIVFGRSDATLNPGGIRIGTAEIYRVVEAMAQVVDSIVIGQRWQDDTRVVLYVVLRDGEQLDTVLVKEIKQRIRQSCTPRHVPAVILAAPDVPRTISGKKVEIAVTRVIHDEPVANRDALKNPLALDFFTTAAGRP